MLTLEQLERKAVIFEPQHENGKYQRLGDDELKQLPPSVREWLAKSRNAGPNPIRMGYTPYRTMIDGSILSDNATAITGTAEASLWPVADYSGIGPNTLRSGQIWHVLAWGIMTNHSAAGNITITPRWGTTVGGGISLGASAATALVNSATTQPWRLEYSLMVRKVGLSGLNTTVVGNGKFEATVAAIAAATGNVIVFGSTAAVSIDAHASGGILMGMTLGHASDTMTTMGVIVENSN